MSRRSIVHVAALLLVGFSLAGAQTVDQTIDQFDSRHRLGRPVQMAVSLSGASVAISDQNTNLIYVIDQTGILQWLAGEATRIDQPSAVAFDGEDRVLFSSKGSDLILAVRKTELDRLDTVADLTGKLPAKASIDQMITLPGGNHLVLDRSLAAIYRITPKWDTVTTLIARGDRKGQLWAPSSMTVDLSGNIVVADEGSYPIQTFSRDGRFLFQGSWNAPQNVRSWSASAVGITRDDQVWVADISNSRWRIFDRTGNEIGEKDFTPPLFRPNAVVVLPDNRMLVADERGILVILKPE